MATTTKRKRIGKRAMIVEVAKDVLKLTRALMVKTHTCFLDGQYDYETLSAEDLQLKIPKIAKNCTVCAKGAMLLAHVHLYDGMDYLPDNNDVSDITRELFGKMADAVEGDFEDPIALRLTKMEPKARLRAIMRKVIANGGTYKRDTDKRDGR